VQVKEKDYDDVLNDNNEESNLDNNFNYKECCFFTAISNGILIVNKMRANK
jgi:hypothetical protein